MRLTSILIDEKGYVVPAYQGAQIEIPMRVHKMYEICESKFNNIYGIYINFLSVMEKKTIQLICLIDSEDEQALKTASFTDSFDGVEVNVEYVSLQSIQNLSKTSWYYILTLLWNSECIKGANIIPFLEGEVNVGDMFGKW